MSALIAKIILFNLLIGTLFVLLFTLRYMIKLKRAIDILYSSQSPEQVNDRKSDLKDTKDYTGKYQPHYNSGGGGGAAGVSWYASPYIMKDWDYSI